MTRPPVPAERLPKLMYVLRNRSTRAVHGIYPTRFQAEEARRLTGNQQAVEIVVYSGPSRVPAN